MRARDLEKESVKQSVRERDRRWERECVAISSVFHSIPLLRSVSLCISLSSILSFTPLLSISYTRLIRVCFNRFLFRLKKNNLLHVQFDFRFLRKILRSGITGYNRFPISAHSNFERIMNDGMSN